MIAIIFSPTVYTESEACTEEWLVQKSTGPYAFINNYYYFWTIKCKHKNLYFYIKN